MKIQNGFSLKPLAPEDRAKQQDANLKQAAQMYENHFLNEMVKAMRTTTGQEDDTVIKHNFAEKIFSEQLDQQYVDGWAKKGGVGLADMIYTQIKEQYGIGTPKPGPHHMMPIGPQKNPGGIAIPPDIQMKAIPPENGKMSFRFEAPNASGNVLEAQVPMDGKITNVTRLDQGWNSVSLDHGHGLRSELTFPGQVAPIVVGSDMEAGQKLGTLDPGRPVLAWNLDQEKV